MPDIVIEIFGYIATACTSLAALPQLIKTLKTRDTSGISLLMFLVLTIGYGFWLVYGCFRLIYPMIIGNAIGVAIQLVVLIIKIINMAKGLDTASGKKKEVNA